MAYNVSFRLRQQTNGVSCLYTLRMDGYSTEPPATRQTRTNNIRSRTSIKGTREPGYIDEEKLESVRV